MPRRTKHAALTEQLREVVLAMSPGDRLPAQDELMQRYGVSDRTVLRSLDDLQRDGWIVRRPGSGTYVTDPSERRSAAVASQPVLATESSRTITVFAPHFYAASYIGLCADMISEQAKAAGLAPVFHSNRYRIEPDDLERIEAVRPRGFLLIGYPFAPIAGALIGRGHRAVVLGTPLADTDPAVPCVHADHETGGYIATRHLLERGHRRLAFAFDDQMEAPYAQHPRWLGHRRAIEEANVAGGGWNTTDTLIDSKTIAAWRHDASLAAAYFRQPGAPTGIAVWNDGGAIILLGILHRAGLRVPEDVSVIGFDAMPECLDSIPPLTSVDQHLGWQVRTVLNLLTRPTPPLPQAVVALPTLVERASCGPPPSAG